MLLNAKDNSAIDDILQDINDPREKVYKHCRCRQRAYIVYMEFPPKKSDLFIENVEDHEYPVLQVG